jgi:hypothetical protein
VKDIHVRSWLGEEYWRVRGDALEVSREQSYGIFQEALVNYARWVSQADGIEVWVPLTLPECTLGMCIVALFASAW